MKYRVTLVRIGYREAVVEVEAAGLKEAKHKALDQAGNTEFKPEHDSEYATNDVQPVEQAA